MLPIHLLYHDAQILWYANFPALARGSTYSTVSKTDKTTTTYRICWPTGQSSFATRNARLCFEEAEASVKDDKVKLFEPCLGFPQLHLVLWSFICCRDAAEWFLKCSIILKSTYHKRNCWDSLKTILVIHLSTQFSTTNIWFKVKSLAGECTYYMLSTITNRHISCNISSTLHLVYNCKQAAYEIMLWFVFTQQQSSLGRVQRM